MPLIVDWSVRAEPIALSKLSHMTNRNAVYIKQLYRSGDLGPAPDFAADVIQIPLSLRQSRGTDPKPRSQRLSEGRASISIVECSEWRRSSLLRRNIDSWRG